MRNNTRRAVAAVVAQEEAGDGHDNNEEEEKYLKTYKPGETFGELALLYNAPRAATIRAKENSVAWSLDRETFNHIVKDAAMKKRAKYETFLSCVDILKSIDSYEITQISDALKIEYYKTGDQIIKVDEEGDKFFILEDGLAYASKQFSEEGTDETVVKEYQPGDYFGELALIKNDLRAANVYAKVNNYCLIYLLFLNIQSDCKILTLDRASFKRLLGPVENILQRLSSNYIRYVKDLK